jgi:hypothetical protein
LVQKPSLAIPAEDLFDVRILALSSDIEASIWEFDDDGVEELLLLVVVIIVSSGPFL